MNSMSYLFFQLKERPMIDFIGFFTIIKGYGGVDEGVNVVVAANDRITCYGSVTCNTRVRDMTGFGTG